MNDKEFRFKIGDLVVHVDTMRIRNNRIKELRARNSENENNWRLREYGAEPLTAFRILERLAHECYGGVQRFYICRPVGDNSAAPDRDSVKFSEPEVEAYKI